jgi:RNA polymerase sigma-70 factor (ECF subfamily)
LNKEQGLSIEEIAVRLNIKEQVVRNQLSLALRTLRGEMGRFMLLFTIFFMGHN